MGDLWAAGYTRFELGNDQTLKNWVCYLMKHNIPTFASNF